MFKALESSPNEEIIILDPQWGDQVERLREMDRRDELVCPRCRQPVRVRAGTKRRWHFAHKHLADCPLQSESPALLAARAVLYGWLVSKFEAAAVTLEKELPGAEWPCPVDCWVEIDKHRIAYWIVEAQMKPAPREALKEGFEAVGAAVNWVLLTRLLQEDEATALHLHLSTTERELMQASEYNHIGQSFGGPPGLSLHYLDPETETLHTLRSLRLIHSPQLYGAKRKESRPLAEVLVLRSSGEFVHPGEHEQLQA